MTALLKPDVLHETEPSAITDISLANNLGQMAAMTVVLSSNRPPRVVRYVKGIGELFFQPGYATRTIEHFDGLGDLVVVPPTDFCGPHELPAGHNPDETYVKHVHPHHVTHADLPATPLPPMPDDSLPAIRHLRAV